MTLVPIMLEAVGPVDLGTELARDAQYRHERDLTLDALGRGGRLLGTVEHGWTDVPTDTGDNPGDLDPEGTDPLGYVLEGVGPWSILTSRARAEVDGEQIAAEAAGTVTDPALLDLALRELAQIQGGCERTSRHTFRRADSLGLSRGTLLKAPCLVCGRTITRAELLRQAEAEAAAAGGG